MTNREPLRNSKNEIRRLTLPKVCDAEMPHHIIVYLFIFDLSEPNQVGVFVMCSCSTYVLCALPLTFGVAERELVLDRMASCVCLCFGLSRGVLNTNSISFIRVFSFRFFLF